MLRLVLDKTLGMWRTRCNERSSLIPRSDPGHMPAPAVGCKYSQPGWRHIRKCQASGRASQRIYGSLASIHASSPRFGSNGL
jgi:hypothetical protein